MGQISKIDYEKYAKKEENPQVVDKKEGNTEA